MPSGPWVVPALLLVLVLAISAAFKVRDHVSTASAFRNLRLPGFLDRIGAPRLLPYGEFLLALALLVVPHPAYVVVAALAVVLFSLYLVVVWRALGSAEEIHCNCFGTLGLGEIDRRTVVRNAVLLALAVLALVDGLRGGSVIGRFTDFDGASWGWLAGVIGGVLLTGLVMYRSEAVAPPAAAPIATETGELDYVRTPVPYGQLLTADGELQPLHLLAAQRPTLLVSLSLTCGSCQRTMDELPDWAAAHPMVRVVAIPASSGLAEVPDLGPSVEWLEDPEQRATRTLGMQYPSAVLLAPDGLLAGGPEQGAESIARFLEDIHAELVEAGALEPATQTD
ncbi:TlpA family protein disulfide reductase [Calidifontibacter terrae]